MEYVEKIERDIWSCDTSFKALYETRKTTRRQTDRLQRKQILKAVLWNCFGV